MLVEIHELFRWFYSVKLFLEASFGKSKDYQEKHASAKIQGAAYILNIVRFISQKLAWL